MWCLSRSPVVQAGAPRLRCRPRLVGLLVARARAANGYEDQGRATREMVSERQYQADALGKRRADSPGLFRSEEIASKPESERCSEDDRTEESK